jgi:transposase-like protein
VLSQVAQGLANIKDIAKNNNIGRRTIYAWLKEAKRDYNHR